MTSMRFEYITAQEAELFKRRVHSEDRLRKQFVDAIQDPTARRVWRGFDGQLGTSSPFSQSSPLDPSSPHRQSVQLFSKKQQSHKKPSALPPVTHQTLEKHLLVGDCGKPTSVVHPTAVYQSHPVRLQAQGTQTSSTFPLSPVGAGKKQLKAIPNPPPLLEEVKSGGGEDVASVFSRGSSSVAMLQALKKKKRKEQPRSCSSTVSSSVASSQCLWTAEPGDSNVGDGSSQSNRTAGRSVRTSSTAREKLRTMSERLSRIEERIQDSVTEEQKVHESLEAIKQLVLNQVAPPSQ